MDCLHIFGPAPLAGVVRASGSKNAALPIMAASILASEPVTLSRVPRLRDVATLSRLLRGLGMAVGRAADGRVHLKTEDEQPIRAPHALVRRMRASFCVLGPMLARRGRAVVSLPGGCNLGARTVELHLRGLAALGAELRIEHGDVIASATRLRGAEIDLRGPLGPTVTGTANVICAAALAEGRTIVHGAAREPEIVDLGNFLQALGARIQGLGSERIEVDGVDRLGGCDYTIIPDRIEAATLLLSAAVAGGRVTVADVIVNHLSEVLATLESCGCLVERNASSITLSRIAPPRAIDLIAKPFPGIPTDLQAQFMALLAVANGTSHVADTVFPERFMHVAELSRLGARIERRGTGYVVRGVRQLTGATVAATDLRAGAALVLAGLMASGETIVRRVDHLDRGYERLEHKLATLGASVMRRPLERRGSLETNLRASR